MCIRACQLVPAVPVPAACPPNSQPTPASPPAPFAWAPPPCFTLPRMPPPPPAPAAGARCGAGARPGSRDPRRERALHRRRLPLHPGSAHLRLAAGGCVCVCGGGGGVGGGGGGVGVGGWVGVWVWVWVCVCGGGGGGGRGGGQGAAAAVWRQQEAAGGRWELQRLERGLQGWLTAEGLKEAGLQATASQLSRCLQGQLPTRRSGAAATPGRHPTGSCHSTAPPAPHAHAVPCVLAPTHLTRSASLSVPLRPARLGSRKRKTATAGCR